MTYTRIGWHSDHQSRPTSDIWPGLAITVHLDATSPANGFLRVVPGSHLGGTEDMPRGFEKVPGEIGVYCDRGDVMFHHSDLWHSAARATEDPPLGVRRHLRGTFLGGRRLAANEELEPFNKNAAR
jgi:ectoine hydroxylase-related dioxygenase (phytanoyl-CoA dioxygenase family)